VNSTPFRLDRFRDAAAAGTFVSSYLGASSPA
jgi:hypothetical protein